MTVEKGRLFYLFVRAEGKKVQCRYVFDKGPCARLKNSVGCGMWGEYLRYLTLVGLGLYRGCHVVVLGTFASCTQDGIRSYGSAWRYEGGSPRSVHHHGH